MTIDSLAFVHDIVGRRNDEIIFDLTSAQRRIAGMHTESASVNNDFQQRNERIDPGFTNVPTLQTFQSKDKHSDVSPQQLSERWGMSPKAATATLRKTTQRFLRSAILPISRRYRTDMMFERKTLRAKGRLAMPYAFSAKNSVSPSALFLTVPKNKPKRGRNL